MTNNILTKRILNEDLVFDSSGALFIRKTKIIVLSDIHFGKSTSLNKYGNQIPPYDIKETIEKLKKIICYYKPIKIISLGDSFHDKFSILNMGNDDLTEIKNITNNIKFLWITGNHDEKIIGKEKVGGKFYESFHQDNFYFRHIKTHSKILKKFEFSGHFHPKVSIKINNSRYYYKCFLVSENFCILPSFGHYTGGLDVNSNAFKKIITEKADLLILGKNKILQKKYLS